MIEKLKEIDKRIEEGGKEFREWLNNKYTIWFCFIMMIVMFIIKIQYAIALHLPWWQW